MIQGLDHIGIAVSEIDDVLPLYEQLLGLKLVKRKKLSQHKIEAASLVIGKSKASIELMKPLGGEGPISKFLEKRGQGLHHIALKVDDIGETLSQMRKAGVKLIDDKPRKGLEGGKIAFVHPSGTGNVLIELCQH